MGWMWTGTMLLLPIMLPPPLPSSEPPPAPGPRLDALLVLMLLPPSSGPPRMPPLVAGLGVLRKGNPEVPTALRLLARRTTKGRTWGGGVDGGGRHVMHVVSTA
jgi:hypothetical protein